MKFKTVMFAILLSGLFCILTACGAQKPLQETQIKADLPIEVKSINIEAPYPDMDGIYEMDVESVAIEKRQTNDKSDVVYCTLELSSNLYHFTKHVVLHYNFYDKGGWILDSWSYTADSESYIVNNPDWRTMDKGIFQGLEAHFLNESTDLENGKITYFYDYDEQNILADCIHNVSITYQYLGVGTDSGKWDRQEYDQIGEVTSWHADNTAWSFWALSTATWNFIIDRVDISNNEVSVRYYDSAFGQVFENMKEIVLPIEEVSGPFIELNANPLVQKEGLGMFSFSDLKIGTDAFYYYGPAPSQTDAWREMTYVGEAVFFVDGTTGIVKG